VKAWIWEIWYLGDPRRRDIHTESHEIWPFISEGL
jgi:hypothetical protein